LSHLFLDDKRVLSFDFRRVACSMDNCSRELHSFLLPALKTNCLFAASFGDCSQCE
jgi:hypothetical protein